MDTIGSDLGEKFVAEVIKKYFETSVQLLITNTDYERYLSKGRASKIKVKTFGDLSMQNYTRGKALDPDDPTESEAELDPNQQKAYYFEIDSLDSFEDYVNNPGTGRVERAVSQLKQAVDTYVLGLYTDVASGNRVGVDYSTGTVTVVDSGTTGAVTGSGTTFTSGMAGLGFKATGMTAWARIKTYNNATSLTIIDDSDDDTEDYTQGAVSGAAYIIEAAAVRTVTKTNIVDYIDELAEKLDEREIPKEDRWIVVPAKIAHLIRRSEDYTPAVESAYQDVVKKGLIGMISGFSVYQNEQVAGNNTTGYYVAAGHKSAVTFCMEKQITKIEEDITGEFGMRWKGLWVYGAKIADERRKAWAYLWCKT